MAGFGTSQAWNWQKPASSAYKPVTTYKPPSTSAFNPFPGKTADDQANYGFSPTVPSGPTYGPGSAGFAGGGGMGGHMVTPDYSGILGSFTADARARFGAGQQAMEAQRLSNAKGIINRLGIRDVPGMLEKMQAYGLTQADLEGARDNPWSELKALDQQKRSGWNNAVNKLASQGGFRSGGSMYAKQFIDQESARNEAGLTQDALGSLSQGQFEKATWEREQRDQMEQAIANQQAQLAAAYQPYWQQD